MSCKFENISVNLHANFLLKGKKLKLNKLKYKQL